MDFYFDEQLPKLVAEALNTLEKHDGINRVLSTEIEFGKGIKDPDLYQLLKKCDGILITKDLKMITRKNEFSLITELGITVFFINLPDGSNFNDIYQTIIVKWQEIKKICKKRKRPFLCKIKMRGAAEFLD